ncbi:protein of unknown function [uncultured Sphingopyxis sp.]|uniref:Mur ligase N-terminal catalytic domain-containing protein n=1 Tax=uncultured Sphingopyxis sp. TaxID=310581 RepID=A0A1Y5PTS5_9SPHN|nr:protein of unknown function [uncultured Sphingopyxis sp.]
MRLAALLDDQALEGGGPVVTGLAIDHRKVAPGTIFGAFAGENFNGEDFIPAAVEAGAVAIVARPEARVEGAVHVADTNPRRAFAHIAARFFHRFPATCVAVTGTNGKTTVTALTRQLVEAASAGRDRHQRQDLDRRNDASAVADGGVQRRIDRHARHHDLAGKRLDRAHDARHRHFPFEHVGPRRRGRHPRGVRGVEPRPRPVSHRGSASEGGRLHQPQPRSSRLSWHNGGLSRGQAAALRRSRRAGRRGGGMGRR